jgi:hypothetical protein
VILAARGARAIELSYRERWSLCATILHGLIVRLSGRAAVLVDGQIVSFGWAALTPPNVHDGVHGFRERRRPHRWPTRSAGFVRDFISAISFYA